MRILLYNPCYFRDLGGKIPENFRYGYRHLYCSPKVQKSAMDRFADLITSVDPDIVALIEVEIGSATNKYLNQLDYLMSKTNMVAAADNKYKHGHFLKYNNLYIGKSNGYLSKKTLPSKQIFLRTGFKSLVYMVNLPDDILLCIVHLATLSKKVRHKQLEEIRELTRNYKSVIICGDFNIYGGIEELAPLTYDERFVLVNDPYKKTFPAASPKFLLDIFLVTKNLAPNSSASVVDSYKVSDHLPVLFEI